MPTRRIKNQASEQSLLATGSDSSTAGRAGPRRQALARQTRDAIAEALRQENLGVGAKLPSEHVLAERLGVGRSTIREAMKVLEQDGIIEIRRGMGSFVSVASQLEPERPITQFESITNMMRELGFKTSTVVLSVQSRKATPADRAVLGLRAGANVVETRRLRELDGQTCIYSVNVIDSAVLDQNIESIDWSASVVSLLDRCGQAIVASTAHIRAVDGPQPEDELPDGSLPRGPWLFVSERCVTRDGRWVLAARDYHHGDIFTFSVVRRRQDEPGPEAAESIHLLGGRSPQARRRPVPKRDAGGPA
jgi:GntR family transcriptional regulator